MGTCWQDFLLRHRLCNCNGDTCWQNCGRCGYAHTVLLLRPNWRCGCLCVLAFDEGQLPSQTCFEQISWTVLCQRGNVGAPCAPQLVLLATHFLVLIALFDGMRSEAVCANVLMQALYTSKAAFGALESIADRLSAVRVVQRITVFTTDFVFPVVVPLTTLLLGLLLTFRLVWWPCAFLWLRHFLGERSFHCQWPRDFFLLCSLSTERQRSDEVACANVIAEACQVKSVCNGAASKVHSARCFLSSSS